MTRADFQEITTQGLIRYRGNEISGVRSQEHNGTLPGAHPDSGHLDGTAKDAWFHSFDEMIAFSKRQLRYGLWVKRNGMHTVHTQLLVPLEVVQAHGSVSASIDWQMSQLDSWATELSSI